MVQGIQEGPEPAIALQLQQVLEEQRGSLHRALVVFLSLDVLDLICKQRRGPVSSRQNHSPPEDKTEQPSHMGWKS